MATLRDYKTIGAPFSNTSEIVRVIYDFSLDGGIATAKDVFIAAENIVIKSFFMIVNTACTGATATLDVGISGGDTVLLANAIPVASLGVGTIHKPVDVFTAVSATTFPDPLYATTTTVTSVKALPFILPLGGKIVMETNTAAFTAGKIELVFEIAQA